MECFITSIDHWWITNFVIGGWHGLIAVLSLVLSLFWDVTVYDVCLRESWFYNFGFLIGIYLGAVVGVNAPGFFLVFLIIALLIKLVLFLALPIAQIAAVIVAGLAVIFLGRLFWDRYVRN